MYKRALLENKRYSPLKDLAGEELICTFSPRPFQNMSLCYGVTRKSLNNRKDFLDALGIDYRSLVCAKQVHADNVRYIKEEDKGCGALSYDTAVADTDALVTDKKGLPLAIFTADCLSIFFYDPVRPAIGLVHAGWRSTKGDIALKTIQFMQEQFHTVPSDLLVGFGPLMKSCCYEVGSEFSAFFPEEITNRDNRYYLDLTRVNQKKLLDAGVRYSNISDPMICTSCHNEDFFSFRKEGEACGRIMSVMMLK